jgi:hypothetical protein
MNSHQRKISRRVAPHKRCVDQYGVGNQSSVVGKCELLRGENLEAEWTLDLWLGHRRRMESLVGRGPGRLMLGAGHRFLDRQDANKPTLSAFILKADYSVDSREQ